MYLSIRSWLWRILRECVCLMPGWLQCTCHVATSSSVKHLLIPALPTCLYWKQKLRSLQCVYVQCRGYQLHVIVLTYTVLCYPHHLSSNTEWGVYVPQPLFSYTLFSYLTCGRPVTCARHSIVQWWLWYHFR